MTLSPELARSYDLCRRIQRRHDPTYYWATRRLPGDVRPAVHALYGFVRGADELVVYMRSMRVDCGRVRIASADELDRYMDGSAGSVGRIMAPLLGAPAADRDAFAALGKAFQLTNFIRDVREDWVLDRVYLPSAAEPELARRSASPRLRSLVAGEVDRARALFAATAPAVAAADGRVRPAIRLARAVYVRVLERIERVGYDVLGRRTGLTPVELGQAVAFSLGRR